MVSLMTSKDRHRQGAAILAEIDWQQPPAGTFIKYGKDELRALEAELAAVCQRLAALRPNWPESLREEYIVQYDALCIWRHSFIQEVNRRYLDAQLAALQRDRLKSGRNLRYLQQRKRYGKS